MTPMNLIDRMKVVVGCAPAALTSTAGDGDYVSMKGYDRLTIILSVLNATTVTGGAVTLKQATDVTNSLSDEKALSFSTVYANTDVVAAEALTAVAVVSDTFTTSTTNSKSLLYIIEVKSTDLDINNGFDCVRLDSTLMAAATGCAIYILHGERFHPSSVNTATSN